MAAPWNKVATVAANVTTHADSTLTIGTTYRYRVRSYNGVANSAYSDVADGSTVVPLDPTNLVAGPLSTTRIDLAWSDNADNETGYQIERCAGAGCTDFALIATTAATHYIARYDFHGDEARLHGLIAGCRRFLFRLTISGSLLAIFLAKPLSDFLHFRPGLTFAALACVLVICHGASSAA